MAINHAVLLNRPVVSVHKHVGVSFQDVWSQFGWRIAILGHVCVNVYLSVARSIVVVAVPVSDVLSEILG